jgi:GH24 family phage-related lysozyme (muramidase)
MTSPYLIGDLKRFEAFRAARYQDTGGVWTNGYGNTQGVGPDTAPVTEPQAAMTLAMNVRSHINQLDGDPLTRAWWRTMDDARQDALAEMSFNLGEHALDEFTHMLGAMRAGDFALAAECAEQSDWYDEVNGDGRGDFICDLIRTGVRPS